MIRLKVAPNTSKMAQNNVREIKKKSACLARCAGIFVDDMNVHRCVHISTLN